VVMDRVPCIGGILFLLLLTAAHPAFPSPRPAAPPDTVASAPARDTVWNRPLPLAAGWALERGIDLPNPFGVGLFAVTMSRDIGVGDVRVTLPGNEPVSIGDVASFDVRNNTTLGAVKVDAWILPLLNVYGLVGYTWTDTKLQAAITIDRVIGDDVVVSVAEDSKVGGPLIGAGATAVAGFGPWFVMADANFNYSDIEMFVGGISAWFLSARTGWSGPFDGGTWRGWVGAAYLDADRTITIQGESAVLGTVTVDVDQAPVNPTTLQAGGSIGIGRKWDVMVELGSNFDDAFIGVFSAAFRF
jgi:hypothetical protein